MRPMPHAFTASATIDRPVEQVWAALTDWANAPQWMNGIDWMDGKTAPGATLTFHTRGKDRTSEIVALEPGRSLTLRSVQGGATADYVYALSPTDDGRTVATLTADCEMRGALRLLGPVIRPAIRRTDGGQMDALKSFVEAG